MNILFWVLQSLLALHTLVGAVWKFTNSEQSVPSLNAIPHAAWMGLSAIEILCGIALLLPVLVKPLGSLVPVAVGCIAAEMLIFCAVHVASGAADKSPMVYWLVVAALCGFIAYGRLAIRPLVAA
jgi:uncharacterized membrane protein